MILDSERSDKRIDFTIMCVFLSLECTISSRNHTLIFNFDMFSNRKVNLVGTLGNSKFKISSNFQKRMEKQKFYTKSFFDKIDFDLVITFKKSP